jgi:hypothetical protein
MDLVYVDPLPGFNPFHYDFDPDLAPQYAPVFPVLRIVTRKPWHAEKGPILERLFFDDTDEDVRGALQHLVSGHLLRDVEN